MGRRGRRTGRWPRGHGPAGSRVGSLARACRPADLRERARPRAPHARGVLHGDHGDRPNDRPGAHVIAHIANLGLWEWFKLRRRWMMWILLVFAILFAQLAVWGSFFSYQNLQTTGGELTVPASLQQQQGRAPRTVACNDLLSGNPARQPADLDAQVVAGLAAQCRQQAATLPARLARAYQGFSLPGSVSTALGIVQTLALILIATLTASAIAIDYGAGTLRSVLTQGVGRWPYLTAKIITLALIAFLGLVAALATVAMPRLIATAI